MCICAVRKSMQKKCWEEKKSFCLIKKYKLLKSQRKVNKDSSARKKKINIYMLWDYRKKEITNIWTLILKGLYLNKYLIKFSKL